MYEFTRWDLEEVTDEESWKEILLEINYLENEEDK
jgi:hypothetical protein